MESCNNFVWFSSSFWLPLVRLNYSHVSFEILVWRPTLTIDGSWIWNVFLPRFFPSKLVRAGGMVVVEVDLNAIKEGILPAWRNALGCANQKGESIFSLHWSRARDREDRGALGNQLGTSPTYSTYASLHFVCGFFVGWLLFRVEVSWNLISLFFLSFTGWLPPGL